MTELERPVRWLQNEIETSKKAFRAIAYFVFIVIAVYIMRVATVT